MALSGVYPRLAPGLVSIYGTASIYGFTLPINSPLAFGVIYQMADEFQNSYSVGDNVLLPYQEANKISYQNTDYWIINQDKIILVEVVPSPAP